MSDDSKQVATQPLARAVDVWGYVIAGAAALATIIDQFAPVFPDKWKPAIVAFGVFCAALAGVKTRQSTRAAANEFGTDVAPTHPKKGGS